MARAQKTPREREQQIRQHLDSVDFDGLASPEGKPDDLRKIAAAYLSVAQAETSLDDAVQQARANGRTWTQIAAVLGVSRQAATERFGW